MNLGHVRDNFPRLQLSLSGQDGRLSIEFIIDTGFEGELCLPPALASRLQTLTSASRLVRLADGTLRNRPYCDVILNWQGEVRRTEVLIMEGNPLLGVELLADCLLQIEMTDGGEVTIEPL